MMRGRNWLAAAGMALALAGCDTVSSMSGQSVAELDTASAAEASVNIGSLSEVVSRNPNDPGAYNTRGAAYARVGRYSDAIADFTKAVQLDPNLGSAYTNRALALRQSGRNDAALEQGDVSGSRFQDDVAGVRVLHQVIERLRRPFDI